jgi:hypothetical protein
LGTAALAFYTKGSLNTAVGYRALSLYSDTDTAVGNTAIGNSALLLNINGSYNTAIGSSATVGSSSLTNATAIGAKAQVDCSNCVSIGSVNGINDATSDVNVGIGTNAPIYKLDVNGRMRIRSGGTNFTSAGIWFNKVDNSTLASFVGMFDDNNIGFFSAPASSWNFVSNINTGNVGIGIGGPSGTYKLQVGGSCAAVSFVTISDARYKKNIRPIQNALTTLLQLNAKTYNWNKADFPKNNFDDKLQMGFIAQEVEKVLPAIVTTDAEGYKAVNYIQVIPLLMQGIKEQQIKINELEARSNKLEKELVEIKKILLQKTN